MDSTDPTERVGRISELLQRYSRDDAERQRVQWSSTRLWQEALENHRDLRADLETEVATNGGIRRSFVHDRASRDPVELFLAAMAWGFGPRNPRRYQAEMLKPPLAAAQLTTIVQETRQRGAAAGWTALLSSHTVRGLGMAFGTKLLYFAGYTAGAPGPRPLILDRFVRAALIDIGSEIPAPPRTVHQKDYLEFLALAETCAKDASWSGDQDTVEYALFQHGKELGRRTHTQT